MTDTQDIRGCRLEDALVQWCGKDVLEDVSLAEEFFTEAELFHMGQANLGNARGRLGQYPGDVRRAAHVRGMLEAAWERLLHDFRRRIEGGMIYLTGVRTAPRRNEHAEPIPSAWAIDMKFDVRNGTVEVGLTYRYVAVMASSSPPVIASAVSTPHRKITDETVSALSDEEVLLLLEEHAKRVVEKDAKLIAPGTVSLMPIIRRKMLWRAEQGETDPSARAEFITLAEWIASKVPSHRSPGAKSIENALRADYKRPKA